MLSCYKPTIRRSVLYQSFSHQIVYLSDNNLLLSALVIVIAKQINVRVSIHCNVRDAVNSQQCGIT